jgi:hypothetical protein
MSKSDSNIYKKDYEDFINKCHDIANKHEEYCDTHCFKDNETGWYPHTRRCIDFRRLHHESFVECNSIFCLKMNEDERLKPSYIKPSHIKPIITELTYTYDHSDNEDS